MGCDFFWPDICVYEHCGAKFFFGMFVFYFAGVCMYVFVVVYTKIYQCPGIVTDQYSRHIHLRYMDIGLRIVCICVFVCNIFFSYIIIIWYPPFIFHFLFILDPLVCMCVCLYTVFHIKIIEFGWPLLLLLLSRLFSSYSSSSSSLKIIASNENILRIPFVKIEKKKGKNSLFFFLFLMMTII